MFCVVGVIISDRFIPVAVDHLTLKHYVIYSCILLVAGVAIFYALMLFGMDPFWSLYLAERWCSQPDWIHPDTSLLYALVRDSSSLLGQKHYAVCCFIICNNMYFFIKCTNWLYNVITICTVLLHIIIISYHITCYGAPPQ